MRLPGVRHSGRHRKRLCVSALRLPELSAQVRRPNSSTSYIQGYGKGVHPAEADFLSVALRTAVAAFAHRMRTVWCKSLSQLLKCNLLRPHEAPELAKLQAESYVGVRKTLPLELAHEAALRRRNRFFNLIQKACAGSTPRLPHTALVVHICEPVTVRTEI